MNDNPSPIKSIGKRMMTISWVLLLIALTFAFGLWEEKRYNPNSAVEGSENERYRTVTLKRNAHGHYIATGTINGQSVVFLLDTGATHVSVPQRLARKLKLKPGLKGFAVTANGTVEVRATTIDTLTLGPVALETISASINPGMKGEEVLLGMSVLKQLDFSQSGNELTLTQTLY